MSDVEPAWIISALGLISGATFGLFGFLRGRRMEQRLNDTFALLAEQMRQHPEEAVGRRVESRPVTGEIRIPAGASEELLRGIEENSQQLARLPDRSAAWVQLWSDGAEPQQIADLSGAPESEVVEALATAKDLRGQLEAFWEDFRPESDFRPEGQQGPEVPES